jgi:hypothetical protein
MSIRLDIPPLVTYCYAAWRLAALQRLGIGLNVIVGTRPSQGIKALWTQIAKRNESRSTERRQSFIDLLRVDRSSSANNSASPSTFRSTSSVAVSNNALISRQLSSRVLMKGLNHELAWSDGVTK